MSAEDVAGFAGHDGRQCGEHRPTGQRAWCFGCTEWCYPDRPCAGCELPQLRARLANARPTRTYYRAVLIETGRLWCESRYGPDVLESRHTAPGPVRLETSRTYEVDGPWEPWTPEETP